MYIDELKLQDKKSAVVGIEAGGCGRGWIRADIRFLVEIEPQGIRCQGTGSSCYEISRQIGPDGGKIRGCVNSENDTFNSPNLGRCGSVVGSMTCIRKSQV